MAPVARQERVTKSSVVGEGGVFGIKSAGAAGAKARTNELAGTAALG
ncbi:MAG: hypothetical protein ACKOBQ_02035 [Bacteroidota bacterium]